MLGFLWTRAQDPAGFERHSVILSVKVLPDLDIVLTRDDVFQCYYNSREDVFHLAAFHLHGRSEGVELVEDTGTSYVSIDRVPLKSQTCCIVWMTRIVIKPVQSPALRTMDLRLGSYNNLDPVHDTAFAAILPNSSLFPTQYRAAFSSPAGTTHIQLVPFQASAESSNIPPSPLQVHAVPSSKRDLLLPHWHASPLPAAYSSPCLTRA
jgi:hypothetical protein